MSDKLNLIETIAKEDKFSVFSRLLGTSGANSVFSTPGQFTVFAPTNDAFGKIADKRMDGLLNEPNQTELKALLSYHVMPGKVLASTMGAMMTRASVTGEDIAFSDTNGLKVNGAGVQARNLEASNGVIHQIDTVLTAPPKPSAAAAAANADTLPMIKGGDANAEVSPDDAAAMAAASNPSRTPEKPIF